MPVRVTCPSCATQLNIKDEHAGRAVKCPKCQSVIPAAQATEVEPPPLPPELPPPSASESPTAARPTAKPAASKASRNRDDDEDDDRPRKRSPRRRDDGEDDDRPRNRPAQEKSGVSTVLIILGVVSLVCCGGAGGLGFYLYKKAKEVVESVEKINLRVNRGNYDQLTEGMTTREVEDILGPGKIATREQILEALPEINRARIVDWGAPADNGRVVLWRNGDDILLAGFYPSATNGRLQRKSFQPQGGFNSAEERFASDEEAARPNWGVKKNTPDPSQPAVEVSALELAKAYKDDAIDADLKYMSKKLLVDGTVRDVTLRFDDVLLILEGSKAGEDGAKSTTISCALTAANGREVWRLSRGQKIKIRGKCDGVFVSTVNLADCKLESQEADPSFQAQLTPFLAEFTSNATAAEAKYKDKSLTLLSAVVESKDGTSLTLVGPLKKSQTIKIKATLPDDLRKQLDNVKLGSRVTVKGEFSSFSDGTISLNRCWLVP